MTHRHMTPATNQHSLISSSVRRIEIANDRSSDAAVAADKTNNCSSAANNHAIGPGIVSSAVVAAVENSSAAMRKSVARDADRDRASVAVAVDRATRRCGAAAVRASVAAVSRVSVAPNAAEPNVAVPSAVAVIVAERSAVPNVAPSVALNVEPNVASSDVAPVRREDIAVPPSDIRRPVGDAAERRPAGKVVNSLHLYFYEPYVAALEFNATQPKQNSFSHCSLWVPHGVRTNRLCSCSQPLPVKYLPTPNLVFVYPE